MHTKGSRGKPQKNALHTHRGTSKPRDGFPPENTLKGLPNANITGHHWYFTGKKSGLNVVKWDKWGECEVGGL